MMRKGVLILFYCTAIAVSILVPTLAIERAFAAPAMEAVGDLEWSYDGCIDESGIPHVIYSTQEGLMFADVYGGRIENRRLVSGSDAQEACMVYTKEDRFLIAFIVEGEFFDTTLELMSYDGKDVLGATTVLSGTSYHDPCMAYMGNTLYLAIEQGGSGEGSNSFSSDIALLSSTDDGATWSAPSILFDSIKDESKPSMAAFGSRLYLSFVQAQNEEYSQQGNAWEAEDNAVMISSMGTTGVWSAPFRLSYDIAEVSDPALLLYGDDLAIVWATNMGDDGIENTASFSCMLFDGYIWSDQIIFITGDIPQLVPLFIRYTDRLIDEGGPVPTYLSVYSDLAVTGRDPGISLSSQEWNVESDTVNEPFRNNVTIQNDGNAVLTGYIDVPKRTDYIVLSASVRDFEVDPGDEITVSLTVEIDRAGDYELTVFFRSNDADNSVMPFFVSVKVKEPAPFVIPPLPTPEPLVVVSVDPLGEGVTKDAPINIHFSIPVDDSTFPDAFSATPQIDGLQMEWSTDRSSVTIIHADLAYDTVYSFSIGPGLVSLVDTHLEAPFNWTFTTAPGPVEWYLDNVTVTVKDDRTVNVLAMGRLGLLVYFVIDDVGSYQLAGSGDGRYAAVIAPDVFEWNVTYTYHLSNVSGGADLQSNLSGEFTTPVEPQDITPVPEGEDEGIDIFAILAIIALVIIAALIIVIFLLARSRSKGEKALAGEMAIFFSMLLLMTAAAPMIGSGQEVDPPRLMDEEISGIARSRVNITDDMSIASSVMLLTRAGPGSGETIGHFTEVVQVFDVGGRMVDGIYFQAEKAGPDSVPVVVTVLDLETQKVLKESRVLIGDRGEYLVKFNNTEPIGKVQVKFSTKDVVTLDTRQVLLGCVLDPSINSSEVMMYTEAFPDGRIVLMDRFNHDPLALGARYYDPKVFVVSVDMDKRALLLDKDGDSITATMTLMNALNSTMPVRVRAVCYDADGTERDIADQYVELPPTSVSSGVQVGIGLDLGLSEGRYLMMIGLYHQDKLIYRFGDDPFEQYSAVFLASYRRIADVSVLPTDRIRPGGHFNVAILEIEGVQREVDDAQVDLILGKYRAVAQEYALSYDVKRITDIGGLKELIASEAEDYALINTHGSILPLPDEYLSEFTGTTDTTLLMHFNEYKEKPLDSSAYGNIIENYPKSRKPDNAFWVQYDGGAASTGTMLSPLFVNGLVDLPARPTGAGDPMVSYVKFVINFKVMDLPKEGDYSQIASFWNRSTLNETFWSMRLWNSRLDDGNAEVEVRVQDGSVWKSSYFVLPYGAGFDIGEWTTFECEVDRSDPSNTVRLRIIDRFQNTVLNEFSGVAVTAEMDSHLIDSLLLANNENDGTLAWKSQPLEAVIGSLEYFLKRGDQSVGSDTWNFLSETPVQRIASYYGRTGTIYGSLYSMNGAYKPQFSNAYYFLGKQWLEVVNNDKQKLSEFTIEFMMRMDQRPADKEVWTILSKAGAEDETGYFIEVEGAGISNVLRFGIGDGAAYHELEYGDVSLPAVSIGAWHKVVAIYDGGELTLQVDGQEVAVERADATIVYDNSPIMIGGSGPERNYLGLIDELIISKGFENTDHNIKYADWLSEISTWISSCHSVWVNPAGYPLGYLGMTDVPPIYYGDTLFKQLLAPLTHTPGEFLNSGKGATRTPQGVTLDDEFASITLPATLDYGLSCLASREGAVIPLYYDTAKDLIPAGAVKFGEGSYAFSTVFSPDITVALSMIRLPNDYVMNILNYEHYKGEDIIVAAHIVNPSDRIETYFVNLTVSDPFGKEYTAHSKNVTVLPGKEAEVHLLFQPKKSTYPKGTYRLFVNVERMDDHVMLDIWGDDDDESRELVVNLIDDVELEVLEHANEISHNGTLKVPVRVINHGALPAYVNIELSVLSPSGGVFDVSLEDRIMVSSHKSKVVELEWDPAKAVEEQSRSNLVVDLPFGNYKVLVAMYDAESVLYTSSILNQQTKGSEKRVYLADDMEHLQGAVREADGWSIEPQRPPVPGLLCKSMGQNDLEDGDYVAQFDLMINDNDGPNELVANVSVWFGDTVVAYRDVMRHDFINPNTYQFFDVPFSTLGRRNQALSFRTHWEANCYLKQDKVEVIPFATSERIENIELRTKPIDFEYSSFSILAETQITAFLTKEDDHYVSAEVFYEVGEQKGSFDVPKTDQCYSFTLYHYPKDTIYITTKGLGGGKDLKLSAVRTTETFIIQKKGSKLIDVEHGYSGDVVDITITESISNVKIKDTLTLEDLSIYNYTKGVTAGFDDEFSRPYVQFNNSQDWAEIEVDVPASKVQRLTIEAFEEPGKEIVFKCLINTSKDQLLVTFAFLGGSGTWTQNSTNVELASGHYTLRVGQQRDGYHARMYPEVFVTPLPVFDHAESAPEVQEAGNSISVCILGLGFNIDLSFIPRIPNIPIPGIEVPKLSIGDTLKIAVVDSERNDVEHLELNQSYYLRIRVEYTHEMKDSKKSVNATYKDTLKYTWKKTSDRPGIDSLTFIVGVELGFVYKEGSSGIRYPDINSFGLYELGIKIKIRLKAWSNPGTFLLDICTGGSGSLTPGVSEVMNVIFGGLRKLGFDIGAGLYLMIEATLIFTPHFKLIFNIYPLGEVWAKIVLSFWLFKFTILDLKISLVLPIGLTVIADSGYSPWNVSITFFIKFGGKLVLFMIKIFEGELKIDLWTLWISKGVPRSRSLEIPAG